MKENFSAWRQNLAKELKEEHRKNPEAALESLVRQKSSDDYIDSEVAWHRRKEEEHRVKKISNIISKSHDFESLKAALLSDPLIEAHNEHLGTDHGANLVKKMEMALQIGDLSLVPAGSGLRAKFCNFFPNDFKDPLSSEQKNERYQVFLRNRFPDLKLSNHELEMVSAKLPAEVFGSLDERAEKCSVLLNTIPEIKTLASCGGHFDAENVDEEKYANNFLGTPYVYFKVDDADYNKVKDLAEYFKIASNDISNVSVETDRDHKNKRAGETRFTWRYKIMWPTPRYMAQSDKATYEQILEKSSDDLMEIFGVDVIDWKNKMVNIGYAQQIQADVFKYRPDLALSGFDDKGISKKISRLFPFRQFYEEHKDYYHSPEPQQEVKKFFDRMNEVLNNWRADHNS